ncbi:phosphate regulon sensor histidine kinase PhoR [Polaromonas sp.]|uniref:phosphate regulon sensor histidine kinase PhoR n=1 Tax=Polaromonas sp. TaxID=1869339 RepID=UPI0013B97C39|nr:phosphate regulon sensor histidine kinase PhoR [Polaromonas sp.]NDP62339.1 phosphate regulon sensor histidine kinase PhoR [Polaromonas sp.]
MIGRWIVWTVFALAGGALGWWLASREGLAWGLLLGAAAWQLMDSFYARRLLNWLRSEQSNETPVLMTGSQPRLPGVWGEAADRVRRLLKNRHVQYRESQARLDEFLAALQASPNGVVLLDDEGRIEWCNQTAAQHFGFDARRDIQQHIANLVRDPAFSAYMAAANFSQEVQIPGNFSTAGRPVRLSVHVHRYGKDKKLLLSRDITALEQAEAMRRDFVANVSHEIRTPLTVVAGFIETLQNLPLKKPDRDRYLTLMAQQSQRMQTLVEDLLTLSRLEGSPLPGTHEWTSTTSLFAQCEQESRALSSVMSPQGHQLVFDAGPACDIAGIGRELGSALSNLVTNAVRYTPEAGLIRVTWTLLPDGRGSFCVRDSGPGIAAEHLPRLTERFYRVDRSRSRETGGTGLGLAIVKHVAQRHGAELQIESQVGQGSCFCIVFPAARVRRTLQPA